MNEWLFLVICLLAIMLALLWWHSQLFRPRGKRALSARSKSNPYHAVSIIPGDIACNAVKALQNRRYLANEAIKLPLEKCDAVMCHCIYQHHADRRSGRDRRYPSITSNNLGSIPEHRSGSDRRSNWYPSPLKPLG